MNKYLGEQRRKKERERAVKIIRKVYDNHSKKWAKKEEMPEPLGEFLDCIRDMERQIRRGTK